MGGQTNISKSGKPLTRAQKIVLDKRAAKRKRIQSVLDKLNNKTAHKNTPKKTTTNPNKKTKKPEFTPIPTQQVGPGYGGQRWLSESINLINQINPSRVDNEIDPLVGKTSKRNRKS